MVSTQFVRSDTKGNELTRIIDFTDNDITIYEAKLSEIEFMHEIYFSLCTSSRRKLQIGFDIDDNGDKIPRCIIQVIISNGEFLTAFPVRYTTITRWQQGTLIRKPNGHWFQGREVSLQTTLDKTTGRKPQNEIMMGIEMQLNREMLQREESLLTKTNSIDSTQNWKVMMEKSHTQVERILYIPAMDIPDIRIDLDVI